jgi:hypothetical protein
MVQRIRLVKGDVGGGEPVSQPSSDSTNSVEVVHFRAIRSRATTPTHPGHAWLFWPRSRRDEHPPYRGYYPLLSEVPRDVIPQGALERGDFGWMTWFFENRVPGVRMVDFAAVDIEHTVSGVFCDKAIDLSLEQRLSLEYRCSIPKNESYVEEGMYCFNQDAAGLDNCVSWAVKRCRDAAEDAAVLPLPNPARIKKIIAKVCPGAPTSAGVE